MATSQDWTHWLAEGSEKLIEEYGVATFICMLGLFFQNDFIRAKAEGSSLILDGVKNNVTRYIDGYANENPLLISGLAEDLWEDVLVPFLKGAGYDL